MKANRDSSNQPAIRCGGEALKGDAYGGTGGENDA
jgi:hypothetical protein